jgi:hypothetical protein
MGGLCLSPWRTAGGILIWLAGQEGDDAQNDKQHCQDQNDNDRKWGHGILLSFTSIYLNVEKAF